jgi:hypothetical protein
MGVLQRLDELVLPAEQEGRDRQAPQVPGSDRAGFVCGGEGGVRFRPRALVERFAPPLQLRVDRRRSARYIPPPWLDGGTIPFSRI